MAEQEREYELRIIAENQAGTKVHRWKAVNVVKVSEIAKPELDKIYGVNKYKIVGIIEV